jgi:hypothetical protein
MQDRRKLFWYSVPVVAAVLMLLGLLWYLGLPWAANEFGFALPGAGGLPSHIEYNGHNYTNPSTCAREGWCQQQQTPCRSLTELQQRNLWPLIQVGTVPILFSSAYPLMIPRASLGKNTPPQTIIVSMNGDCYVYYTLTGT